MRYIASTFETLTDTFGELIVGLATTGICLAFALIAWYFIVRLHERQLHAGGAVEKPRIVD